MKTMRQVVNGCPIFNSTTPAPAPILIQPKARRPQRLLTARRVLLATAEAERFI